MENGKRALNQKKPRLDRCVLEDERTIKWRFPSSVNGCPSDRRIGPKEARKETRIDGERKRKKKKENTRAYSLAFLSPSS